VQYTAPHLNFQVQLPRLRTDKGLLTLLLAPHYLGELTLEQPTLVFQSQSDLAQADSKTIASNSPERGIGQRPVSWWERWRLQLTIQGGRIVAEQSDGIPAQVLARDIALQSDLTQGTVTYTLAFRSQEADGHFRAQGFVNLPNAGQPFLPSLVSESKLDIAQLEIEPLLALAAARMPRIPRGKGVLDASCRLHIAGTERLDLEGKTALHGLELTGGALGADHPVFDELTFRFQGSRHPTEGWQLTYLDLHSLPLRFSAHGVLDGKRAELTGNGEADLAQLATHLPNLLAIHDQTSVRQGRLHLGLEVDGPLDNLRFNVDCKTDQLDVIHAGRPYFWKEPLVLHAKATADHRGIRFNELQARAPFLTVDGQGGKEDFSLRATAELDPLFEELGKVFLLDLRGSGRLAFDLSTRVLEEERVRVESRLGIDNFQVFRGGKLILPSHPLSLQAEVIGTPWFALREGVHTLRVEGTGWPGTFSLSAEDIQGPPSGNAVNPINCRLTSRLDLQRLTALWGSLQATPPEVQPDGLLQFEASGQWHREQLLIDRIQGDISDFLVSANGIPLFQDPRIRLKLDGGPLSRGTMTLGPLIVVNRGSELPPQEPAFFRIDMDGPSGEIRHLRLESEHGIVAGNWLLNPQLEDGVSPLLEFQGVGELSALTMWAKQRGWLSPGLVMNGQARVEGIKRFLPESGASETELAAKIEKFAVIRDKDTLVSDPQVQLDLRFTSSESDSDGLEKITRLGLSTSRFSLVGTGVVHNTRETPSLIELQGEMQPSPAALGTLAAALVPGTLDCTHAGKGHILFSAPLRLPFDLNRITLAGRFPVEAMEYRGLSLRELTVLPDLNRGILRLPLTGRIGGGQVDLRPQWQWQESGPLLSLPPESQVLRDVPIDRSLTTNVLHLLPPLGCLVQATGTISLRTTRFSLPLNRRNGQADFAVVVDLQKARPKAVQALQEVLIAAGLAEQSLRFKERELICEGWGGSTTCAPLRLVAGDYDVVLTGSMQRNGTLAYRVEMPVTEHLSRKAGVAVFGRFAVAAEISGTRSATFFDQQAFLGGLAAQLTAELPKPLATNGQQPPPAPAAAAPASSPSATN
jgi:hypothetical protein